MRRASSRIDRRVMAASESSSARTRNAAQVAITVRVFRPGRRRQTGAMDPRHTIVFQWLAAGDAGQIDAFDHLLHPDAVVHAPAGLSTTGAEEEKAVWRDAKAAVRDLRHEVQEVVVDGDVEMARVVVTGTLTSAFGGFDGTGRRFRIDQAVIVHLREGKVAEAWEIADMAALTAQVSRETPP